MLSHFKISVSNLVRELRGCDEQRHQIKTGRREEEISQWSPSESMLNHKKMFKDFWLILGPCFINTLKLKLWWTEKDWVIKSFLQFVAHDSYKKTTIKYENELVAPLARPHRPSPDVWTVAAFFPLWFLLVHWTYLATVSRYFNEGSSRVYSKQRKCHPKELWHVGQAGPCVKDHFKYLRTTIIISIVGKTAPQQHQRYCMSTS